MTGSIALITAARLTPLVDEVVRVMQRTPLPPLETETIVVQSQGMRRWVTLQLADRLGCAASLALPFPASFMHDLASRVRQAGSFRDDADAFSRDALTWRIEAMLRELGNAPVFDRLRQYLLGNDDRARFGLAAQIAARFDDYQLYRADVLAAWESGVDLPDSPHAPWQAALWRALRSDCATAVPQHARIRATIDLLERERPVELPPRVTVFGVSALPPLFIELLAALARHIPVTVFTAAVTSAVTHPLALAFGAQGREFVDATRATGASHVVLPSATPAATSLLATLHAELADTDAGSSALTLNPADASLQIHDAHGERRQLEIVRDQLLVAMQDDASVHPHDLLLLVPDAAAWAPMVDAVFGVTEPGLPSIRYRIADRPGRSEDEAAEAFAQLLALHGGRFTHTDVFQLLSHPLAQVAAGLSVGDVDRLHALTREANTRWGYDAASRVALGFPDYEDASWRQSLDRLILGVATGTTDDLILGVLPAAGDTAGDPEALARLATWVDRLARELTSWDIPRSLVEWSVTLTCAVTALLAAPDGRGSQSLTTITEALTTLRDVASTAAHTTAVPFSVVQEWLDSALNGDGFGRGFLVGGMTVAALKPMRSLPFKVIAVVGLDEASFPRRERRAAFDLLGHEPRAGDRDVRGDDRQLFLDLLMAAESRLILAYSGRDVADNSPRAASVVIDELLDHLDRRTGGAARAALCVQHPLQPFSRSYFAPDRDPRLFTYSRSHARAATAGAGRRGDDPPFVTGPLAAPLEGHLELSLKALTDCWKNPSRFFCHESLGFTLDGWTDDGGDDEALWLDNLSAGAVRSRMLAAALSGNYDVSRHVARLQATGALPPRALGVAWSTQLQEDVDSALRHVPMALSPSAIPIQLTGAGWRLSGTIDGVRGDRRFVVRAGNMRAEHRMQAWIEHVAMCAARETLLVTQPEAATMPAMSVLVDKKEVVETLVPVHGALALLTEVIECVRYARRAPMPFFVQAAYGWLDGAMKNAKPAATTKSGRAAKPSEPVDLAAAARTAFHKTDGFGGVAGDHADPHVMLCYRGQSPLVTHWAEFERIVRMVFRPRLTPDGAE